MIHKLLSLIILVTCVALAALIPVAATAIDSGVEERLGDRVPEDLVLVDHDGQARKLGDVIVRPTVVALVYYSCPSVCRPLLDDLSATLKKMRLEPGKDYDVLTVSFDHTDDAEGSAKIRSEYLEVMGPGFPEESWTFMTGDSAAIDQFTESVGFAFVRNGSDFAHPTTLVVVGGDGMISRYMFGAEYLPKELELAVNEASQGRTGTTITRMLQFCFSYDPEGRRLVLNVTRLVGVVTVMTVVGFVVFLTATGKRRKEKVG